MTADRQPRADARRNRARVLAAAETVFTARGVEVPIEEVARAAGVGIGTVYRHFPTKQDLVEAIVAERMRRLTERAQTLAGQPDSAGSLFEVIDRVVAEATVKKHLGAAESQPGVEKSATITAIAADLRAALAALLAAAHAAGTVRADAQLTDVLALLYALSAAAEYYGWDAGPRQRAIGLAFDGLRPRPASGRD